MVTISSNNAAPIEKIPQSASLGSNEIQSEPVPNASWKAQNNQNVSESDSIPQYTQKIDFHCQLEGADHCKVCKAIKDVSEDDFFEWIMMLKDWEESVDYTDKCDQMTMAWGMAHTMDRVELVRNKLALLQTMTVISYEA